MRKAAFCSAPWQEPGSVARLPTASKPAARDHRRWWWLFALAVAIGPAAATAEPPQLVWPADCVLGENCWITAYVDHDPGADVRDYACGVATYSEPPHGYHKGTDIAIRDLERMRDGVAVLAAAGGTVVGVRQSMADVLLVPEERDRIAGRECGNGVRVDHGQGWFSQYCHLRRDSIAVRNGQTVAAGDRLGMIGLSGATEYPHLHFQVEKDGRTVDPFVGLDRPADVCGPGPAPLWTPIVARSLPYRPTAIYNAGFAAGAPDPNAIRDGRSGPPHLPASTPALVLWADLFNVRRGDRLWLRIFDPGGRMVFEHSDTIDRNQVRRFVFAGLRRPGAAWPRGSYRGELLLTISEPGRDQDWEMVSVYTAVE